MTFVAVVISMSLYLRLHMSPQLFHSPQSLASIHCHDCQGITWGAEIQKWSRGHCTFIIGSGFGLQFLSPRYIETTQGDYTVYAAFSLETHWTDVPASSKSGGRTTSTPCALSDFLHPPAHHSLPLSAPAMVRLWYRPCATPTNESVNSAMMDPLVCIHALPCRWPGDSVPDSITPGLRSHPLRIHLAPAHISMKSYPPDSPLPLAMQQSFRPPFPPTAAIAGIDTASASLRARCWQCGDERHG
ncbi:hypothetical protein K439DRAFT_1620962 [Ramaria rubella]|nr:hypothetical protein K439DRAFT_1620962 [Ramaria rubella]